jgi:diaminopimelate decarboxylase
VNPPAASGVASPALAPAAPLERRRFWSALVRPLLARLATPFYLFSVTPVREALAELDARFGPLPVRHWFSCKTQPLRPLLRWWRGQGRPVEVVSEFEFLAARAAGFPPEQILVNGPAKHHWLPRHAMPGLSVNLDSAAEARALAPLARRLGWRLGLRLNPAEEFDPESPGHPTQFGLTPAEALPVLRDLRRRGRAPEILHFHLRTNVASTRCYERALREAAVFCAAARWRPRFVDCGGGWPPPGVRDRAGRPLDAQFDWDALRRLLERARGWFPEVEEFWLENGRWLTARSGVLVVTVLDVKERRGLRHLICDGGRTLHALVSLWEQHDLFSLPARRGPAVLTGVTGPTCMAFDQLARRPLPRGLRAGDRLVWLDAGAYHLAWETRFSHGLAAVAWHDGRRVRVVRRAERFTEWGARWG